MSISINFNNIKDDKSGSSVEPGRHRLKITRAEEKTAGSGSYMLQFDYEIVGTPLSIRYDNCPVQTAEGQPINFGLVKLQKMIEATGLIVGDEIDLKVVAKLLLGKELEADLVRKEGQKYLELDGTKIYPIASDVLAEAETVSDNAFMTDSGTDIDEDDEI